MFCINYKFFAWMKNNSSRKMGEKITHLFFPERAYDTMLDN